MKELLSHREKALVRRHSREHEKWNEHTRRLPPLKVGDHVYLQNLVGNHPRRWARTGIVVEVRQYHQYVIRVDGTGRVTIRNRQHLRKFTAFQIPQKGAIYVAPTPVTERPQSVVPKTPPASKTPVSKETQPLILSPPPCTPRSTPTCASPSQLYSSPPQQLKQVFAPERLTSSQPISPQLNMPGALKQAPQTPVRNVLPATRVPRALASLQLHNKDTSHHRDQVVVI
jgi:hypothetical protein